MTRITKLLIASRGAAALRIARACEDYGVESVAVFTDLDADAPYVRRATEAVALREACPTESAIDVRQLLTAAASTGADAVHPGDSALAARADVARAIIAAGLIWVGAPPEALELLSDRAATKRLAAGVGATLISGGATPVTSARAASVFAEAHGLPIVIRPAFDAGQGCGPRIAYRLDEVEELFSEVSRDAQSASGSGGCLVERYLGAPRLVAAQVLADAYGALAVVGTRDGSLQRRNRSLVEEAPAPYLSAAQRDQISDTARALCAGVGIQGSATVEFLLETTGSLAFLGISTRLQPGHHVTEESAGVDVIVEQLRIADGLPLTPLPAGAPRHSIGFRIDAEDPARGFLPTPGIVSGFRPPNGPGVRVDPGVDVAGVMSPRVGALLAQLIVTGATRDEAIRRARRALAEFRIEGVATTIAFHLALLEAPEFVAGEPAAAGPRSDSALRIHTQWIESSFAADLSEQPLGMDPEQPGMIESWVELDGRRFDLRLPASLISELLCAQLPDETPESEERS